MLFLKYCPNTYLFILKQVSHWLLGVKSSIFFQLQSQWTAIMTSAARYAYGYNRGTNVASTTSHFLAGFKACSTGGNTCLVSQSSPGPMVEPIILLKWHSIKLHSKFLSLYPQITAVLRYQRSLCAVGNTETRNWSKEREKGVWIVQPQMGHLFQTPSSSSRTTVEEAERLQEPEAREE